MVIRSIPVRKVGPWMGAWFSGVCAAAVAETITAATTATSDFMGRILRWPAKRKQGRSDVTEFQRLQHRTRSISHAELRQDARRMVLHRAFGRPECVGNLAVAVAAG